MLEGLSFTAFHPVDAVGYASLHLLRHLLRGDAKPFHVYELASFLHQTAGAEYFWSQWRGMARSFAAAARSDLFQPWRIAGSIAACIPRRRTHSNRFRRK